MGGLKSQVPLDASVSLLYVLEELELSGLKQRTRAAGVEPQFLSSPFYPVDYYRNTRLTWHIQASHRWTVITFQVSAQLYSGACILRQPVQSEKMS